MEAEEVEFAVADGIARVTLNRPARRNALSASMANALTAAWERIDADASIGAVVLAAAPCGTFCAGMDLKEMAAVRAGGADLLARIADPFQARLRTVQKPVVAALGGHFSGAGMLLAMGADIRVGLAGSRAAISEARFGRGTAWAVPLLWMLPQAVLSEMVLTGAPVPVEELWRHGFVNHLEPTPEAVLARACAVAAAIVRNAPLSVLAAKATLAAGMDLGCAAGLVRGAELHRAVYASADAEEGPRAFAEGRPPVWQGR
ncbi:enoyl-CoA hydratase/isomerase family protein [Xanthobacter tagetidis]|uniref:Enoyl-CoA hydratase/isomerase family protein n=1 Tax=Xanthobacter tagetidis TaxID=60216 RepID=A0A3L7APQ5_9HYPH|nr:enoyl-CoA hydratase-related protein [Xanthobacter tagetidis]MBB6307791.1 enoyl-CoA hydratase/carnithine racemase [Xanthobacter tagetidis]RLP81458.1 enoyl-CoA hydratase/isomerase family protein [Xanthobacter tagetidis]